MIYYQVGKGVRNDILSGGRHEIFPEFSGIPEFCRPQRSFSWKPQIRFNIYGGGGGVPYCVC